MISHPVPDSVQSYDSMTDTAQASALSFPEHEQLTRPVHVKTISP